MRATMHESQSTTLGEIATNVHPPRAGVQIQLPETLWNSGAADEGAIIGLDRPTQYLISGKKSLIKNSTQYLFTAIHLSSSVIHPI